MWRPHNNRVKISVCTHTSVSLSRSLGVIPQWAANEGGGKVWAEHKKGPTAARIKYVRRKEGRVRRQEFLRIYDIVINLI